MIYMLRMLARIVWSVLINILTCTRTRTRTRNWMHADTTMDSHCAHVIACCLKLTCNAPTGTSMGEPFIWPSTDLLLPLQHASVDVIEDSFKQVLVCFCGLGGTTIESMLPVNYDKIKISKDPSNHEHSFLNAEQPER